MAETQRLAAEKAAEEERIRTAEQARIAEEQAQKAEAEQARIAEAKEAEAKEAAEKEAEAKEADADEDHFGFEAEPYEDEAIREVKEDAKAGQAVILMINPKLHTIYDYLTTIKPGKIRGDEIKNNFMHITQLYNEINDIVDSRKDDKYNINLIRTFQTKYNNNINIDAATDALDELGEALPDYKNMPAELKKTLIISLQDKIYELMRHFGMEKTETPFVNELKKTMIILGSKVNKADNAKLKLDHITINEKIVNDSVVAINALQAYIDTYKNVLILTPLSLSFNGQDNIKDSLVECISILQNKHAGYLSDKHKNVPLVDRLKKCIGIITDIIANIVSDNTKLGGNLSRPRSARR